jgi:hypothetical protein
MTTPQLTVPIVPSASLPESTLTAFLVKAQQSGRLADDILAEMVVDAIKAFNQEAPTKKNP